MRVGIADHLGWAVAVTASADHEVVDRRRIELVEPGLPAAPIHYEGWRLDVAATVALVAKVRASVVRATSAALDELANALPAPVESISLRAWPLDFPDDIVVQRRAPYEARVDAIMYRQVLSELAHARGWDGPPLLREGGGGSGCQPCWLSGPTRSCTVPGQRWGRRGRRTIGSRSRRRSWAAEPFSRRPAIVVGNLTGCPVNTRRVSCRPQVQGMSLSPPPGCDRLDSQAPTGCQTSVTGTLARHEELGVARWMWRGVWPVGGAGWVRRRRCEWCCCRPWCSCRRARLRRCRTRNRKGRYRARAGCRGGDQRRRVPLVCGAGERHRAVLGRQRRRATRLRRHGRPRRRHR